MQRSAHHHRSAGHGGRERAETFAGGGSRGSGRAIRLDSGASRAGSPTELATLLRLADGGTRRRLADAVQASHGNAGLVSLLGAGTRIHGLPAHVHAGSASDYLEELASDLLGGGGGGGGETETEGETDDTTKPIPTSSGTTITVSDTTFAVTGEFATMAANLAARAEAGSVTSQISDIYLEPMTGLVKLANITVTETRSLPTWSDRGTPLPEQVAEWDRFRAALAAHEQAHIDIDTKAFTNLHAKAIGVTADKANERIDAVEKAATALNDAFDSPAQSDHGRNAGTNIDTNVGAGIVKVP